MAIFGDLFWFHRLSFKGLLCSRADWRDFGVVCDVLFVHAVHVMAGKERKGSLEGLASKIHKIDGSVPVTILKNPAVVTKVGNINVPVKQSLEPKEGDVVVAEQVQQMEAESYLDKKDSRKGGGGVQPSVTSNRFEVFNLDPGPSERNSGEGVNNVEELGADTHERGTIKVDRDPNDCGLRDKERVCALEYEKVAFDLELFLKQKAKVEWLKAGDSNTAFFHKMIKRNNHKKLVDRIIDSDGNVHEGDGVASVFENHYSKFLGTERFSTSDKVADLVNEVGSWRWPQAWYDLFPVLINIHVPLICNSRRDVIIWLDDMGVERKFSVHTVWETIRYRSMEVDWFNIVWFTYCIPRHAFHVWLKSTAFFCHVPPHVKDAILEILPFEEGTLPVRSDEER
ncbi:hypothetical protein QVD17_41528 [Tagetes erecta]|uniref:Uncharacterized protein n=1 Tax=Tagetes erecta TaxID=13708 RepID=A0AAD8JLZ9_TARER|nr:hypothetical protein QVD17_41528 [Tagetes erecta]